ncbi:TPA: isoleucine--tRNA ligase [Candidatus Dependentiae bacterium]|nr:MAG: Isoleucine-tRNA ligase [candidate division TM6 bacterium GW2011_GWE2_31_21]KKP53618.1 MAG: Isoleucine-tRNA ligase [candidate division TM6 bacterium GW2011_GWF2_33_332]HBS48142.1 isoleucine--tRNA ligase [Candidatus Dependentiae bacterium]HBZ73566.1 isoleucine--tRNA ligase [Candidatus Dependentiae bacterium]
MANLEEKKSFKDSLNLPTTGFSIRANAAQKEAELLQRWEDEKLDGKILEKNIGKEKFILHDGPPYANGSIHMGHAFNKIFKDIVCKFKRMSGFHVPFKPGWDCHGLPIEIKVNAELKEKGQINLDRVAIKTECRKYATKWINIQRDEFKKLGIFASWNDPYLTMDFSYEASILRAFAKFVEQGYIERKLKTVPWCFHCQSVLAAAEIEHQDRSDPSCYIFFPLTTDAISKVASNVKDLEIGMLVWTTTPWTIPLNRAVVLNPNAQYVLLEGKDNKAFFVAEVLADNICKELGIEKKILAKVNTTDFATKKVGHPFIDNLEVPILHDKIVTLEDGTACMHMAPGCGPEDYLLAVANGIEIYSPLTVDGKYSSEINPKELEGMVITDGQIWVIKKLASLGRLIHKASIKHSYPHCWRCHNGLMFRATKQWFCNLQKNNLLEKTLKETDKIDFYPESGKLRFKATIGGRAEWCISRQKNWGVPIAAILCKKCDNAFINGELIGKVADKVEKIGIEFWDKMTVKSLIDEKILASDFVCPHCGDASNFENLDLERDILDVWFDSGVSSFAVLQNKSEKNLQFPADLYLEGSDQHRGWFQSSLLCSMIMNDMAQTKAIATHGFVVDVKGHKMSKSVGNVIAPFDIVTKYSTDILRLWVASCDYDSDMILSEVVLKNVSEVYRKIRNTSRFLISNLYDFDFAKDAVSLDKMLKIDQYALARHSEVEKEIRDSYENYNLIKISQNLSAYCANDLSAFYLDIAKDRLYTDKKDGLNRKSAQTVCYYILDSMTRLMAPILSFLAEEISDAYQKDKKDSIHLQDLMAFEDIWEALKIQSSAAGKFSQVPTAYSKDSEESLLFKMTKEKQWESLKELRNTILKSLEEKRAEGIIGHSLEAKVTFYLDLENEQANMIENFILELQQTEIVERFFKDLFIVSQIQRVLHSEGLSKTSSPWIYLKVEHAEGVKCPRCWQWSETKHEDGICSRCDEIVNK